MKKHVKCINLPYSLVKPEAVLLTWPIFFKSRQHYARNVFAK